MELQIQFGNLENMKNSQGFFFLKSKKFIVNGFLKIMNSIKKMQAVYIQKPSFSNILGLRFLFKD